MATINVIIKNINGKELFLNIAETCTINEGKRKIGLSEDKVWLFGGMILNGSKTFKDYEIKDGNVIMDVFGSSNRKEIRVTIKTAKREELPLTILETCTINGGKRKIGQNENYAWKFNATVLNGSKTFKDYQIEDGDTIISSFKILGGNADINKNNLKLQINNKLKLIVYN